MKKEFFIYGWEEHTNTFSLTFQQLYFISRHYSKEYRYPITIMEKLYDDAKSEEDYLNY